MAESDKPTCAWLPTTGIRQSTTEHQLGTFRGAMQTTLPPGLFLNTHSMGPNHHA